MTGSDECAVRPVSGVHRIGDADPHSVAFIIGVALWPHVQYCAAQACSMTQSLLDVCSCVHHRERDGPKLLRHCGYYSHLVSGAGAPLAVA